MIGCGVAHPVQLPPMATTTLPRKMVNANDLIDAQEVAGIIGVSDPKNAVAYLSLYPEMPRPVVYLGRGRARLWVRKEIERWNKARPKKRRAG